MKNLKRVAFVLVFALVCSLTLSATSTSLATYYSTGGTVFTGDSPATNPIGDVSGVPVFQILATINFDGTNTVYSYGIQNLGFGDPTNPEYITGLLIENPAVPIADASPVNWSFTQSPGTLLWLCSNADASCGTAPLTAEFGYGVGIPGDSEPPNFSKILIQVTDPTTGAQVTLGSDLDWYVAAPAAPATPEPASLTLLFSGLAGAFAFRRKR